MARGRVGLALRRFVTRVGGRLWTGAGALSIPLVNRTPLLFLPAMALIIGGPPLVLIFLAGYVAYRVARRLGFLERYTSVIGRVVDHLNVPAMVVFMGVEGAIFFPTNFNVVLILANLILLIVMKLMNTRKSAAAWLIAVVMIVWTVALGLFLFRLTFVESYLGNIVLLGAVAAMASVIAVCIDILVHRKAIDKLVWNRRNAWASSVCLLMATQAYGFGLSYDNISVDAILAQEGVSKIATYEDFSDFRSRTQARVNLVSQACHDDQYLIGYFMDLGTPAIAYDNGSEEVVALPDLGGDASENYINFCERDQYLVGTGNRLVLLQEWYGSFVVRDEVIFEGNSNYVYRFDLNRQTGQNYVNVWNMSHRGVAYEVKIVDDRIVLGERIEALMTIHNGDTTFLIGDGEVDRIDGGNVTAKAAIADQPRYTRVAFSARNNSLFLIDLAGSTFGKLDVLDARTLARKRTVSLDKGIRFLGYNEKHDVVVVANTLNGNLHIVDAATSNVIKTMEFSYRLRTIQFSDDQDLAFVACAAGLYSIDLAAVVKEARRPPVDPRPGPAGQGQKMPRPMP